MTTAMKTRAILSAYRWPLFLAGLMGLSFGAHAVLVYVATRPGAPAPRPDSYQRALAWDADAAVLAASAQLGWTVELQVPAGAQYAAAALRPVDLRVSDRDGKPVSGLTGRLHAIRPAESGLSNSGDLHELPQAPGSYRTLVGLPAAGLWQLSLDARRGATRFVHTRRVSLPREEAP